MNKTELVAAIADKAEISKKDYEKDYQNYIKEIEKEIK